MKNNKGFSLVELIVVIAIMAILAAVAIPTFAGFINKANEAADEGFMNDFEYAVKLAYTKEPDKTIEKLTVQINDKGEIIAVKYDMTGEEAVVIDSGDKDTNDVAAALDWTYNFKAKTKVGDAKTDDTWEVTTSALQ